MYLIGKLVKIPAVTRKTDWMACVHEALGGQTFPGSPNYIGNVSSEILIDYNF